MTMIPSGGAGRAELARDRSELAFGDAKPPYSRTQAQVEALRCLFCSDAPCVKQCPTHIEVPQFVRKIATGNDWGAARTIFEANILGRSCARVCPVEVLCMSACVLNAQGIPPIQIGKLQRWATDAAYQEGWRYFEAGAPSGKSVGLIGAGPASLAAAHELRRLGHACTIYEKNALLGGLNTAGIAPYKMKAEVAVEEAEWVLAIGGVEVVTGVRVGAAPPMAELEKRHQAVFVGVGLGLDQPLGVPGEALAGVRGAVAYIQALKLGPVSLEGVRRAVVVGGGNTAVDAARELLGLGVPEVTLVYRGVEARMPGYAHEWNAAKLAGARASWRTLPVAFEGDGKLQRVRCVRTDEAKRPVPGTELVLEADLALVAIGQKNLGELFHGLEGIRFEHGKVVVAEDGATGRKGWFAGGDCANGGTEVVYAAAEGKRAAQAIHQYLMGGRHA